MRYFYPSAGPKQDIFSFQDLLWFFFEISRVIVHFWCTNWCLFLGEKLNMDTDGSFIAKAMAEFVGISFMGPALRMLLTFWRLIEYNWCVKWVWQNFFRTLGMKVFGNTDFASTHFSPVSHFYTPWKLQKTWSWLGAEVTQ